MKILVTGGAGFIGSFLCESLLDAGHDVVCLDNFFTGRRDNIKHLLSSSSFSLIEHDIIEPYDLSESVDQIYHLACPASPVHYQRNAIRTIKTNVMGTINVLGMAKRHNARILLTSTSEVYGDPQVHPQPETYVGHVNPIGPRSCYDEGKRVAETLFFDYHRQNNVDIRVVRVFNTYGPRMTFNDGRVMSNFILQALNGDPITIYGEGHQTRSFCYVTDMVKGLMDMMNQSAHIGPINLGNDEEVSMIDLAHLILDKTRSNSHIVFKPLPQDDPTRRKPDLERARKYLHWSLETDFDLGVSKTIQSFKH
jgi:UDP-glucuronate decarboxylase